MKKWWMQVGGVVLTLVGGCRERSPLPPEPVAEVKLPGDPYPPHRYVALGASDTQGGGASEPGKGYVPQLFRRLAATGGSWELYNLGCNGVLIDHLLQYQLPAAVSVAPDVITLWAGGNDVLKGGSPRSFAARLDRLLGILRTQTTAVIVVGNIPEMDRQPFAREESAWKRRRLRERSKAFNSAIEEGAARYGVAVADLRSGGSMYDAANFSPDGIHPNDAGYAALAERFWAVLEREWNRSAPNDQKGRP